MTGCYNAELLQLRLTVLLPKHLDGLYFAHLAHYRLLNLLEGIALVVGNCFLGFITWLKLSVKYF